MTMTADVPAQQGEGMLLSLYQRALEAVDETELLFLLANEPWHLVPYKQAAVFVRDRLGKLQLKAVSGLVATLEETPYTVWLDQVAKTLLAISDEGRSAVAFSAHDLPENLQEGWAEWWPAHAFFCPMIVGEKRVGAVIYVRDETWDEPAQNLLSLAHKQFAHCLNSLKSKRPTLQDWWETIKKKPQRLKRIGIGLAVLLLFPVRLTVLAPAEIIALKAEAVSAPTDGVVKTFHVQPNQPVTVGQPLFSLDDTTLRNRYEIAQKSLAVARAEALAANQKAFDSLQSKSELGTLLGRVREKEAEVRYLEEMLGRIDVVAAQDGVFIYGDPNDWLGKPVSTGERIAQLAQPNQLGVMVWIPVADAIALDVGASMRVYLQVSPLSALSAELIQTSYQASLSPENVASYRVRGKLLDGDTAHIGLRGVAKVYGGWRPMFYWIIRRPLGAFRQWMGI